MKRKGLSEIKQRRNRVRMIERNRQEAKKVPSIASTNYIRGAKNRRNNKVLIYKITKNGKRRS